MERIRISLKHRFLDIEGGVDNSSTFQLFSVIARIFIINLRFDVYRRNYNNTLITSPKEINGNFPEN